MSILPKGSSANRVGRDRFPFNPFGPARPPVKKRSRKAFARRGVSRPAFEALEELTLLSSSIVGTVWNDRNGDGLRQPNDFGVAGATVYLDLNNDHQRDSTTVSIGATSMAIGPAPGDLGGFGGKAATLNVAGLPSQIQGVTVSMDLVNNGTSPVTVGLASPTGFTVPNFPTLFAIQPGEHFVGTFDSNSGNLVTLASRPLAAGTYRPQQQFTDPPAHMFDGPPNGTWGLIFFGDVSGLTLKSWSLNVTSAEPTATTDVTGNYTFSNLTPGLYQVELVRGPADVATNPTGVSRTVPVVDGQIATGIDFGVQPAADLTSAAFNLQASAAAWGQDVTINYTLVNNGLGDAGRFNVEVRLSNDGTIDRTGFLLTTLPVNDLAARGSTTGSLLVHLPNTPPLGYGSLSNTDVGFLIDPLASVPDNNPSNNSSQGEGIDMAALARPSNEAVASGAGVQQMPSIAIDPTNAKHVVVAYMDYTLVSSGYAGIGVKVSQDGGATWTTSAIPLPADYAAGAATPEVKFDAHGRVYVSFMAATFLGPNRPALTNPDSTERADGFQSNNGIFVAASQDGGLTWGQPTAVVSHLYNGTKVPFELTPDLAVDTFATLPSGQPNPNYGNLYVTWVRAYPAGQFPGQPNSAAGSDIMFAVSTDGGHSWTTRLQTQSGAGLVSVIKDPDFGDNATGNPGTGFMFYPHLTIGPQGDIYVSNFGAGDFTVYHSTDSGASFRAPDRQNQLGVPFMAVLPSPEFLPDPDRASFRTNSVRQVVADPSHPGRVYALEANKVSNPAVTNMPLDGGQIIFARSDDYGLTWQPYFQVGTNATNLSSLSPGQRDSFQSVLNDDDGGNFLGFTPGSDLANEIVSGQALPSMTVDANGNLTVIWYDSRRAPSQPKIDVFGSTSTDGGKTFTANFRITDTSFNPNDGAFTDATGNLDYYLGDQISVASDGHTAFAVWTDTRNGSQDIYLGRYRLAPAPQPPNDWLGPNNTPETAADLGIVAAQQTLFRLALGPNDDDWFRLQTAASGDLIVTATGSGGVPNLELRDEQGHVLSPVLTTIRDATGAAVGTQLVYHTAAGRKYLVHVSNQGAGFGYSLSVGALSGDLGAAVEGARSGVVELGGQALYRLQVGVTGTLVLTLGAGADVQGNLTLQVLGPDGRTVLASGQAGGSAAGQSQRLTLSVTRGQVVLIAVAGADANALGSFNVQFTNFDQFESPGAESLFFPTPGDPSSIALVDVNGDGKPDIVTTSTNGTDTVTVLLSNGDGTFEAPRQYDVGPGQSGSLTAGYRQPVIADFNHDGIPDIAVPNFRSGDVSVLLGNGDGTYQPQRTFDAVASPDSMIAGDFNGDGNLDLIALQNFPQFGGVSQFAVLLGRGDGTFRPANFYSTIFGNGAFPIASGDFNGDGKADLVVFSKNDPKGQIFLGNGDGSFHPGPLFSTGENVYDAKVADLTGDGRPDLIVTGTNSGNIYVLVGQADGTFGRPLRFTAKAPAPGDNVGVFGLTLVDFGSSISPNTPDGHLDLVVTAQSRSGVGKAQVILLPGLTDDRGNWAGFGSPVALADVGTAGKIAAGDFTGSGEMDLAVADSGGVTVIYGRAPTIIPNNSVQTARDLGSAMHLALLPQAIVAGQRDAYFTYAVPMEAVQGSGDQVIDVSALFENVTGPGLVLEVTDGLGKVHLVGTPSSFGNRFRLVAPQGDLLTIHVYGATDGANFGAGVFTLDLNVLPQVVSVQAPTVVPGASATSIVITLQGDRLDTTAAENPANYLVTWLGPDGLQGTPDDQVIPVQAYAGGRSVVYNPSAKIDAATGLSYSTAARQTITLLFAKPLPAGNYQISLSPAIQAAAYNEDEAGLLAPGLSFGHPLASTQGGIIAVGARVFAKDLVAPAGASTDVSTIAQGSAFLTQLQSDLSALLNELIKRNGDDPTITATLNNQILSRLAPLFATLPGGAKSPTFTIMWFDPVSIDLQAPQGGSVSYNLSSNAVTNSISQTFVQVGGNVELLVMANASGSFNLDVSNVPSTARGGQVQVSAAGSSSMELTGALREGTTSFQVQVTASEGGGSGSGGSEGGGGTVTAAAQTGLALLTTGIVGTPAALGPLGSVTNETAETSGSAATGSATTGTSGNAPVTTPLPNSTKTTDSSDEDPLVNQDDGLDALRPLIRSTLQLVKRMRARVSGVVNALGLGRRAPAIQLLGELIDALTRPAADAVGGEGAQRANDAPNGAAPAANAVPAAVPADAETSFDALDRILQEPAAAGLIEPQRNLAEREETADAIDAYWALAFLAAGAYQARLRSKVRDGSLPGEATIPLPESNDL